MSISGVLEPLRWYRRLLSVDCSMSSVWTFVDNFEGGLHLHAFAKDTARFGACFFTERVDKADLMGAVAVIARGCSGNRSSDWRLDVYV